MLYKQHNPKAFRTLESIGMKIPTMSESLEKWNIGTKMGLANLSMVFFGLFGSKYVSIPMFLTLRRCSLLTTVIMNYVIMS